MQKEQYTSHTFQTSWKKEKMYLGILGAVLLIAIVGASIYTFGGEEPAEIVRVEEPEVYDETEARLAAAEKTNEFLADQFVKLSNDISKMNMRINALNAEVNDIDTSSNNDDVIDDLEEDLDSLKDDYDDLLSDIDTLIHLRNIIT